MIFKSAFQAVLLLFLLASCSRQEPTATTSGDVDGQAQIFGGEAVLASDELANRVVKVVSESNNDIQICSAGLIAKDLILTAAHCAEASQIEIYLKGHKLGDVIERIIHPRYVKTREILIKTNSTGYNRFDFAILKFSPSTADLNEPVPQKYFRIDPSVIDDELRRKSLKEVMVSGFGYEFFDPLEGLRTGDNSQQKVKIPVKAHDEKRGAIELDNSKGKGLCIGDSGAPAFKVVEDEYFLIGIGNSVRNPGDSSICTGTSTILTFVNVQDWLQAIID